MDHKQFETICSKLDKIIALVAVQSIEDKDDKIYTLKNLGMTSLEIGFIVRDKNVRDTKGWKRK